jgi:hypothetical protein
MKNRAGAVAVVVLLCGAAVLFWTPAEWRVALPPASLISAVPLPDSPPLTTSFGTARGLPEELPEDDYWRMIREFSEPGGSFRYENFLSNEQTYQDPIPTLKKAGRNGGAYLGVGPEQNFTYIAAIRPQIAFIIDIRRQNMLELLMYKALFAMASDRIDFVSLLFSRPRPNDLSGSSTVEDVFTAYERTEPDRTRFEQNLTQIKARLQLTSEDQKTIDYIYSVFFSLGPDLNYSSVGPGPNGPTYARLMTLADRSGQNWSYLASEDRFRYVKEMQRKNLIIPLVGDFSGPKAIRTVARYLKDHHAIVSAFYLSNVEMYILPSAQWKSFCMNVADLPVDSSSTFIRFVVGAYARYLRPGFGWPASVSLTAPMIDVLTGVKKGYPPSYFDLLHASK